MKLAKTFTALHNKPTESIGWFLDGKYLFITEEWDFRIGVYAINFSVMGDYEMIGTKEIITDELLQELINADLSS